MVIEFPLVKALLFYGFVELVVLAFNLGLRICRITANVDGLLLGWNLKNVPPSYRTQLKIQL